MLVVPLFCFTLIRGAWRALPPTVAPRISVSRFFSSRCAHFSVVKMYWTPALNSPCRFTKEIRK